METTVVPRIIVAHQTTESCARCSITTIDGSLVFGDFVDVEITDFLVFGDVGNGEDFPIWLTGILWEQPYLHRGSRLTLPKHLLQSILTIDRSPVFDIVVEFTRPIVFEVVLRRVGMEQPFLQRGLILTLPKHILQSIFLVIGGSLSRYPLLTKTEA